MLEGLFSTAAGLSAQQFQLDALGNDIANVNTDGYKSERVAFRDLLYNPIDIAGTETTAGSGAGAAVIGRSEAQGALQETGDPLDLAIEGRGYFQVSGPGGHTVLTRDGSLGLDSTGTLVTSGGQRISPPIKVPAGIHSSEVSIASDGTVSAGGRTLGRIVLVDVPAPGRLTSLGGSLLEPNAASGAPAPVAHSRIQQGALEQSNVDLGHALTSMVGTERAFQMDTSALQDESQMMSIANQLRPA